jgi:hypothetical protein
LRLFRCGDSILFLGARGLALRFAQESFEELFDRRALKGREYFFADVAVIDDKVWIGASEDGLPCVGELGDKSFATLTHLSDDPAMSVHLCALGGDLIIACGGLYRGPPPQHQCVIAPPDERTENRPSRAWFGHVTQWGALGVCAMTNQGESFLIRKGEMQVMPLPRLSIKA